MPKSKLSGAMLLWSRPVLGVIRGSADGGRASSEGQKSSFLQPHKYPPYVWGGGNFFLENAYRGRILSKSVTRSGPHCTGSFFFLPGALDGWRVTSNDPLPVPATWDGSRPRIPCWHRVWGWGRPLLDYHTIQSWSWQDLRHRCFTPIRSLRLIRHPHPFWSSGPLQCSGSLWCPAPIWIRWPPTFGSGWPFCTLSSHLGWAGLFRHRGLLPIRIPPASKFLPADWAPHLPERPKLALPPLSFHTACRWEIRVDTDRASVWGYYSEVEASGSPWADPSWSGSTSQGSRAFVERKTDPLTPSVGRRGAPFDDLSWMAH